MDAVKVNLGSPVNGTKELNIKEMVENAGELLITLNDRSCYNISDGESLMFKRYIYTDEGYYSITRYFTVTEDEDHVLHAEIPSAEHLRLSQDVNYIPNFSETELSASTWANIGSGVTYDEHNYEEIETSAGTFYKITFRNNHNIFPQDCGYGQTAYLKSYDGEILGTFSGISIPLVYGNRPATIDDCITSAETMSACGKSYKYVDIKKYTFLPNSVSRNSILIKGFESGLSDGITMDYALSNMSYVDMEFNPFYYCTDKTDDSGNTVLDKYGNPIRVCHLWEDGWWRTLTAATIDSPITNSECGCQNRQKYVNSGDSRSIVAQNVAYWDISMGLAVDGNECSLGTEDSFSSSFISDIEESLIPDFVDMERVKYIPVTVNNDIVTALTFNFHFRQREMANSATCSANTSLTTGYTYMDGWYINQDNSMTTWWNGFNYDGDTFDSSKFTEYYNASASTSDLLGYLNFIDGDVYNRKKKVNKSFIRLSFYTSKDPLEQKLLYYSTVFLDGTGLYGKYLKTLIYMADNPKTELAYNGNPNAKVVFCSDLDAPCRLDSQINITNEYDKTRSAEGFNLYLFADDANITDDGKADRTIYMKVEFNHAGNGKTLPMIMWPRNGSMFTALTSSNFIDSLYIPIKIRYLSEKKMYVYSVPDALYENDKIIFNLFEPKLDIPN